MEDIFFCRMENHSTLNHDNFVGRISSLTPAPFVVSQSSTEPLLRLSENSFNPAQNEPTGAPANSSIQSQYVHPHAHSHQQSSTTSSSTYTFLQIKREPCQVSEITTSNYHQQEQSAGKTISDSAGASTITTVVKIESSSPKNQSGVCNVSGGVTSASMSAMEKSISTF